MTQIPRSGFVALDVALCATVLWLASLLLTRLRSAHVRGLRLPPGPPGNFLIGNTRDLPTQNEWETFTRWAHEYGSEYSQADRARSNPYSGDLVHIKVFRQHMVFVNSTAVAQDLFERRSFLYSDRSDFPMMNDLMGLDWVFPFMHYGERWRRHRRVFHQHFRPTAVEAYHHVHLRQTRDLLLRLRSSPDDFTTHLRHLAGATIIEIVYGIQVLPTGDPYIEIAEKALAATSAAANPGTFLVDTLPILKFVPEWMPGADFQRKAAAWKPSITDVRVVPFDAVKKAFTAGTARPSMTASLLEQLLYTPNVREGEEDVIRNAGAAAYGAGSETTVSVLACFFLAMVLHPEAQRIAQAELDSIIGMGRLPEFEDRTSLPYVNALCKEVLRWHPILPLGIAHRAAADDVYGEYTIPQGSIVIGNTWAILHDEKMYGPYPDEFKPERFLRQGVRDPIAAFGYGRRICPGRYMADNSIFMAVASILKVFDLSLARDCNGKEIPVEASFTSGFVSHPTPFRCSIKPRSTSAEDLLSQCAKDSAKD